MAVLTAAMGLVVTGPANAAQFCNTAPIVFTPPPPPGVQAVQPLVPYPSVINVTGLGGTISDVNVTLNDFTYPFPEDVDVLLVAPDGTTKLLLMSDIGGNNDNAAEPVNDVDLTFDDEATSFAPTDSQLTPGTYKPTDDDDDIEDFAADTFPGAAPAPGTATTLSVFDGLSPNGEWRLYVVDDDPGPPEPGDFGGGWCLDITTSDTSTSSTVAPTSSTSSSTPTSTSTSTSTSSTMPPISTSTSTSTTMPTTRTSTSTSTTMASTTSTT
ncbi:MAG TPA: hypothetical protein VGV86_16750, partial [Acidimicrobiales bacterium]|nr:hypothetical protein [Acidimicrobiales bacterium]